MAELTRRNVMALAAGGMVANAAMPALSTQKAQAQQETPQQQAPGWYRYKLGDVEITAVTDGFNRIKFPDAFVANATRADVNKALGEVFLEPNTVPIPYTPVVVRDGGRLIVIDTGLGEANFAQSKGASGQFQRNFAAAGLDPKDVSLVVISHFHPDHINGLLKVDQSLTFPNAEILVPAAERKYFMDDAEMGKQTSDRMIGLFKNVRRVFENAEVAKRVKPYEAEKEIAPGITAIASHGHTPGHTSHVISSGGKSIFVQADVTNVPFLFARNPGWHLMFDQIPDMAEATRRKIYDMLAAERMMVQGFHYPFPALAHIEKTAAGYREVPAFWTPVL